MKSKMYNISKKMVIALLIACLAVGTVNFAINSFFYNPADNFNNASSVFAILNQLLSPTVTESYLEQEVQIGFPRFSHHSQDFRLLKFSYSRSPYEPQNTGNINYSFGKATLKEYIDRLSLNDLTCRQSLFLSSDKTQTDWKLIFDNKSYEAWLKFEEPIDKEVFSEKYGWLLDNDISRSKQCGISWISIKTSGKVEDICLGLAGNLSFHYMNPYNAFAGQNFYNMDLLDREFAFNEALKFLINHPKDTNIFINTGLWTGAEKMEFKNRYDYVQENGIQYLGFVTYIKGSDLRTLESDSVSIIRLNEDK